MNPRSEESFCALSAIGGSLVVCLVTPAAVYLSADSRYARAPTSLRDSARKLIVCGRTALCGLSGLLRFTRTERDRCRNELARQTTLELSDIVEEVGCEDAAGDEPRLASMFTRRLHLTLAPIWERFAIDLDQPFGYTAKEKSKDPRSLRLAQLFYVNREASGRAFLATIDLTHSLHQSNPGRYSSVLEVPVVRRLLFSPIAQPRLYVRGARRCVSPPPVCGPVDGDVEALRIIEGVFERARVATKCAIAIGGPVDIAVIDTAGRRWLKQKSDMDRHRYMKVQNAPILGA